MNELIAAFTTPYTMQSVNLMLTYTECYACIALFARRFERRDFFLVRIILTLLEGMVVCYLLAIWYTEADSLLVRVLCYSAITVSNFTALMFCWRDDIEEMLLAFCSGMAAYQFTNKLYPLLQNLRGINDRETLALLHPGDASISNLDWTLFFGFHLLSIVVLALLFTPKNRLVHNRRTTRNVIILSIATITLVNILICISRVYEGESPMLNVVTKILYVGLSFTILTICAGIFSQSEQEEQIGILHQLWRQDRAQFESVKANMDVINMKCHDLKHILDKMELFGEQIYITWDGSPMGLKEYNGENKEEKTITLYNSVDTLEGYSSFVIENAYENELRNFFEVVKGEIQPQYSFSDDLITLEWIDRIEER